MTEIRKIAPMDIERESFRIITEELGDRRLDPMQAPILKRVIHTTADFDYADNLYFSPDAVQLAIDALKGGATVVTDTQMALAGINKRTLEKTRARVSMDKAARLGENVIFAIGNAPTALIRLRDMIDEGYRPKLVIGVPVGFVNVVASKELILETGVPCIVARGRKGGSNVAACIVNALLYMIDETRGAAK